MTDAEGFKRYRRTNISELRPYVKDEDMGSVSITGEDMLAGSPKKGDMIARNPKNHADQWLVAAKYFRDNPFAKPPAVLGRLKAVERILE